MMKRTGALVLAPLLLLASAQGAGLAAPAPSAPEQVLKNLFNPVSIDHMKTRIFMPLRNVKVKSSSRRISSWQMEVQSDSPSTYSLERAINSGVLHHLRIQTLEGKTYIHADWRYAAPVEVKVRSGGLEIFFFHRKDDLRWRNVMPGLKYWEGQRWTNAGPLRVRALRLDPQDVRLAPAIASPGPNHMGLATVSRLADAHGAVAAINGSFFSPLTGQPQAMLVMNRNMVSRTMMNRPGVWFDRDGRASIKVAKPSAAIRTAAGKTIPCQAVNESAGHNRVVLYTAHHGLTTRTIPDGSRWELAVTPEGKVVAAGHGNLGIPKGGYVVSGQGTAVARLKAAIAYGQTIKIQYSLPAMVADAIGGGPTLMEDGEVHVLARQQHFRSDVASGRAPRTAIGLTDDGKYVLVCVDGHQPGYSVGATLKEMGFLMKDLGATEALNLDGGGSTTMWLKGHTLNRPSDGRERAVSTALLVYPRQHQAIGKLDRLLASEVKF